ACPPVLRNFHSRRMVFRTKNGNNSQGSRWRSNKPFSEWWESSMWQRRQNRTCFTLGIGVLIIFLAPISLVRAAPDPLDELEKILLEKHTPKRAEQLAEQINKLRISDLRRALSFKWLREDDQWRRAVGKKLAADLQEAAKSKDKNVRLAVANLIAEMGPKKVPALDWPKDTAGFARSLAPIVVTLVGDPDAEVSWEALRALGTINAD